jgi:RimJ/RimL family protein N-acetyltransferase
MSRIYLRTREDNLRARHCFEKCGFKSYGTLWQDGYHFILMELLRNNYDIPPSVDSLGIS